MLLKEHRYQRLLQNTVVLPVTLGSSEHFLRDCLSGRASHPLSVESWLVVVYVLDHDLEQARRLLGRRSQVGGGEDQRVLIPLLPVQSNLNMTLV